MESTKTTDDYLKSLSEKERKAYEIAKSHLGSTFSLEKSNGYVSWSREPTVAPSALMPTTPAPLRPLPHLQSDTNKSPCVMK